jgi:hypothetical protein
MNFFFKQKNLDILEKSSFHLFRKNNNRLAIRVIVVCYTREWGPDQKLVKREDVLICQKQFLLHTYSVFHDGIVKRK